MNLCCFMLSQANSTIKPCCVSMTLIWNMLCIIKCTGCFRLPLGVDICNHCPPPYTRVWSVNNHLSYWWLGQFIYCQSVGMLTLLSVYMLCRDLGVCDCVQEAEGPPLLGYQPRINRPVQSRVVGIDLFLSQTLGKVQLWGTFTWVYCRQW